ncbi:hypothetical protein AB8989_04065 [Yersinia hibernica]|uniref:Uncharacterized protein n=1 Tax=Yersinia hibernica TaxID=2339259 RepID=A0ABX5QW30_9GAMM|nr:hypothetical protein [Yersinia hibernica]QAX77469.1 hypothetical protein D5F51_02175 [Yersinia hibernica]
MINTETAKIKSEIINRRGHHFGDHFKHHDYSLTYYHTMHSDKFSAVIYDLAKQRMYLTQNEQQLEFMVQLTLLSEASASRELLEYVTENQQANINRIILAKRYQLSDKKIMVLNTHAESSNFGDNVFAKTLMLCQPFDDTYTEFKRLADSEAEYLSPDARSGYSEVYNKYAYSDYFDSKYFDLTEHRGYDVGLMVELRMLESLGSGDELLKYATQRNVDPIKILTMKARGMQEPMIIKFNEILLNKEINKNPDTSDIINQQKPEGNLFFNANEEMADIMASMVQKNEMTSNNIFNTIISPLRPQNYIHSFHTSG